MNKKEMLKLDDLLTKQKVKCKCSHTQLLGNRDRVICRWCRHWIYKDKETEFKYKVKEKVIKEKRTNKNE